MRISDWSSDVCSSDLLKVNPARIDGGGPNNIVPDRAVLRVNLRPATAEAEQEARSLITRLVDDVAARHEVSVDVHGGFARPPKPLDAKADRKSTRLNSSH